MTEVKKDDFEQGVVQNIVQMESAMMEKCKREKHDVDGDEEPPSKQRVYGIVTGAERWAFVECTMHEDETESFRMSWLDFLNVSGSWKDGAKKIFSKIAWLWPRMTEEIQVRYCHVLP